MEKQTEQVHTPADVEPEQQKENVEYLQRLLEHFAEQYKFFSMRKERCENLMRRKSVKKWKPEKIAKMVRRLMSSKKELEQTESALDQISHRLSQLGVEVEVVPKSTTENYEPML